MLSIDENYFFARVRNDLTISTFRHLLWCAVYKKKNDKFFITLGNDNVC